MSAFGYAGCILEVDLRSGNIAKKEMNWEWARQYLGGQGLATRILYESVAPDTDALSPENVLIVSAGPLVGTGAPSGARTEVATKSPLTGMLSLASGGGHWAPSLKFAGYDAIIFRGKSPQPVYLWVDNDKVELRDAKLLWGRDIWETNDQLREDFSDYDPDQIRVVSIGPAGENLVRYASIGVDYYQSASRSGGGAVMGSKKLKAIVVHGTGKVSIARPTELQAALMERFREGDPQMAGRKGRSYEVARSLSFWDQADKRGIPALSCYLPGLNFQTTQPPNWGDKSIPKLKPYLRSQGESCYACTMAEACTNIATSKYGPMKFGDLHTMTFFPFVAACGLGDTLAGWKCHEVCERLGMDMISAGLSISFAMELYQRGIVTEKDTDGVPLHWGDAEVVLELLRKIAYREGFGDLLAEGSAQAARQIGNGAERYAMTIGGMEILPFDYRPVVTAMVLGCITSPRGGDNLKTSHGGRRWDRLPHVVPKRWEKLTEAERTQEYVADLDMPSKLKEKIYGKPPRMGPYSPEQLALLLKFNEELSALNDSLGTCIIRHIHPSSLARLYSAVTGWETSGVELLKVGERIFTLEWLFNLRHGVKPGDLDWPDRFYDEPLPDGPAKGNALSRDEMKSAKNSWYKLRDWDRETGIPSPAKLEQLALRELWT